MKTDRCYFTAIHPAKVTILYSFATVLRRICCSYSSFFAMLYYLSLIRAGMLMKWIQCSILRSSLQTVV